MARYLSDEWLAAAHDALGPPPDADAEDALVIEQHVEGGPDGRVVWHVVVAGDARSILAGPHPSPDVTFTQDATVMKLAINRNKSELMCNAYRDYAGKWLINPMFIKPKGPLPSGYACSTTACSDADGSPTPCLDEAGGVIPDQADNVY